MGSAWWCKDCNVPLLEPQCQRCGSAPTKPLANDLVPVFKEEIALLRDSLGFASLPAKAQDGDLWSSGASYFRYGVKVANLSHKTIGEPLLQLKASQLPEDGLSKRRITRFSIERMVQANQNRLNDLEYEARSFIADTLRRFSSHKPVVAFSGGKDSTVVSHLVRKVLGSPDSLHVFLDTTLEAPDTYDYIKVFQEENPQVPLLHIKPGVDFLEMCNLIGPPSRLHRWCCTSHKAAPMGQFIDIFAEGKGVLTFDGIRSCESVRRARLERVTTHHSKIARQVSASPISAWTNVDLWCYVLRERLAINKAYRRGFRRVGCMHCPYTAPWAEYLNSVCYPEHHQSWRHFLTDYAVRAHLPDPDSFALSTWKGRARGKELNKSSINIQRQDCLNDASAFTYQIRTELVADLYSFITPLGDISIVHDDPYLSKTLLLSRKSHDVLAEINLNRLEGVLRVIFAKRKGIHLMQQRFERQLRKMQSCIKCGACAALCKRAAVSVNGQFEIDALLCNGCMRCVSSDCVIVKALSV